MGHKLSFYDSIFIGMNSFLGCFGSGFQCDNLGSCALNLDDLALQNILSGFSLLLKNTVLSCTHMPYQDFSF